MTTREKSGERIRIASLIQTRKINDVDVASFAWLSAPYLVIANSLPQISLDNLLPIISRRQADVVGGRNDHSRSGDTLAQSASERASRTASRVATCRRASIFPKHCRASATLSIQMAVWRARIVFSSARRPSAHD